MAYNDDRQMYDVDLQCAKCNAHISQLPFMPSGDRPVYCADCNREFRQNKRNNNGGGARGGFQRTMFQVNVKCAGCGTAITELPFQPKGDSPVYCRDCYRQNRSN
ncbi:MAG: zinc-binding protein [Candidatus Magasanikbacteria bacterium CG10_big_fil_rev_8_21_14_0_10_40_10]|uniref:Zinc-binding protein n=1 Tax=Candidatus Magasanikbacteria bacterium CG10_big_fil_rev_8_21_14_0_10_40_10 TaxID=1974648 RepID=A0A2M6W4V3_9BACT|nr:MAG: zinc-binding protein [Candidatus Magasanikbacteria bacterium CG10_big_fil_rev_8_21_14_0_10_40_10]